MTMDQDMLTDPSTMGTVEGSQCQPCHLDNINTIIEASRAQGKVNGRG